MAEKMKLKEIRARLKAGKSELSRKYGFTEIGIFGSYAKGTQKNKSDLDILVDFEGVPDIYKLIDLEDELKKLLKIKVDIVCKKAIRQELRESIARDVIHI